MWVYTLIATVLGGLGTGLSIYSIWYTRQAPVRERQDKLRSTLKKTLQLMDEAQFFGMSMRVMNGEMPTELHFEQVTSFYKILCRDKDDYIAPAPEDMQRLIDKVDAVGKALLFLREDPSRDNGLLDLNLLVTSMRNEMAFLVDGLTELEKKPYTTGKQKRQFKQLT